MRMVSGYAMPPLVRPGQELIDEAQQLKNRMFRTLVDNAALAASPQLVCNATPPPIAPLTPAAWHRVVKQQPQTTSVHAGVLKATLMSQLREMIPEVIWKNVYRTDEAHVITDDAELIKLTFYNDQMIKLRVVIEDLGDERTIRPLCDDFEEWKATAIMMCEAGDDVWERPKPEIPGGAQRTATQVNQMQHALQQQGAGAFSGSGQAGAGNALSSLAGSMGMSGLLK